jgi:hypothetical protein
MEPDTEPDGLLSFAPVLSWADAGYYSVDRKCPPQAVWMLGCQLLGFGDQLNPETIGLINGLTLDGLITLGLGGK